MQSLKYHSDLCNVYLTVCLCVNGMFTSACMQDKREIPSIVISQSEIVIKC